MRPAGRTGPGLVTPWTSAATPGRSTAQATLENLVAIGVNNNSSDTFASNRYQGRVVNGVEWQTLDEGSAPSRAGGWHQLKIQITDTQVLFYVDGILSETEARPNSFGFDWVVLGFGSDRGRLPGGGGQRRGVRRRAAAFVHAAAAGPEHLRRRQRDLHGGRQRDRDADLPVAEERRRPGQRRPRLRRRHGHAGQITGADTNDAANYRCRVTNADGAVTSNQAALTVTAAPTITGSSRRHRRLCRAGRPPSRVAASGQAPLSYQWQKDGVNMAGATAATLPDHRRGCRRRRQLHVRGDRRLREQRRPQMPRR